MKERMIRYLTLFVNTLYYLCVSIWRKDIVVNALIEQRGGKIVHKNFGDDLNYYLLQELTGKKVIAVNNLLLKKNLHKNTKLFLCWFHSGFVR